MKQHRIQAHADAAGKVDYMHSALQARATRRGATLRLCTSGSVVSLTSARRDGAAGRASAERLRAQKMVVTFSCPLSQPFAAAFVSIDYLKAICGRPFVSIDLI